MKPSEQLLLELETWCNARYGRRAELARYLGTTRSVVTDWLKKRSAPGFDQAVRIRRFLRTRRDNRPAEETAPIPGEVQEALRAIRSDLRTRTNRHLCRI